MFSIKRPKPGDTEEDIVRQNEEFLLNQRKEKEKRQQDQASGQGSTSGSTPASNYAGSSSTSAARPSIDEILKQHGVGPNDDDEDPECDTGNKHEENEDGYYGPGGDVEMETFVRRIQHESIVASMKVIETNLAVTDKRARTIRSSNIDRIIKVKKVSAFARSKQRDELPSSSASAPTSRSITTRQVEMMEMETQPTIPTTNLSSTGSETMGGKVHPLLDGMTEAEILDEQKKLLTKLDPKLVEFLKSRKNARSKKVETEEEGLLAKVPPPPTPASVTTLATPAVVQNEDLPINPDSVKHLPNMANLELDKLAWTAPTETKPESTTADPAKERNARFDFKGEIISEDLEKDSKTWLQGLHNHGEEMDRAGYTLEELLTLARSTVLGQRTVAYHTFGAIFRNAHDGKFDLMLAKSILSLCEEMDFIYCIRKGIDHVDLITTDAALNCLSGLLYPDREESCLDTILGWSTIGAGAGAEGEPGPWICLEQGLDDDTDPIEKIRLPSEEVLNDDKDHVIASKDLIQFFLTRACLLDRFDYLLQASDRVTSAGIINILKVLIRLARHSPQLILQHPIILDYFIVNHLRLKFDSAFNESKKFGLEGIPLPLVLKLFRLLISSSAETASALMSSYKTQLFLSVCENLSMEAELLFRIPQVEFLIQQSILLWRTAIEVGGHGVDELLAFSPIITNHFTLFLRKDLLNTFDLNHCALTLSTLSQLFKFLPNSAIAAHLGQYSPILEHFVLKTFAILCAGHLVDEIDLDGYLAALQQALEFFTLSRNCSGSTGYDPPSFAKALSSFLSSDCFQRISRNLTRRSLLLNKPVKAPAGSTGGQKYPRNLSVTEAVLFGGDLNPILRQGTPFAFITSLLRYVKSSSFSLPSHKQQILNEPILGYLRKIASSQSLFSDDNYYLQYELACLYDLLLLVLGDNNEQASLRIHLSYKLASLVQVGSEDLCQNFLKIFISSFTTFGLPEEKVTRLHTLYSSLIELESKRSTSASALRFQYWKPKLLNSEWLTQPLRAIHTSITNADLPKAVETGAGAGGMEKATIGGFRAMVQQVLEFIQLCLATKEACTIVQSKAEFVTFYTRICQCFLMLPDIFLHEPIRELLGKIFPYFCNHKILISAANSKKPIFTSTDVDDDDKNGVLGRYFENFYSQLITEYGHCSYGDEVFTAFILLPLRVPESNKLKGRFWTDHCVRFVRLQKENGLLPLNYFTGPQAQPAETDREVLRTYQIVMNSGHCVPERNPFIYELLRFYLKKS